MSAVSLDSQDSDEPDVEPIQRDAEADFEEFVSSAQADELKAAFSLAAFYGDFLTRAVQGCYQSGNSVCSFLIFTVL